MQKPKTPQGWTQFATIVGVAGGLIMLSIVLFGISSTEATVKELRNLVDTSTQQLEILINQSDIQSELLQTENRAVVELAHQTIMQVYNLEKPHKVETLTCSYYPQDKEIVFQLGVIYNNEPNDPNVKDIPSTLTFEIKTQINSRLDDKETNEQLLAWHKKTIPPQLIEPSQKNEWRFSLSDIFDDAKDSKNAVLYVYAQHFFAPYSMAKNIPLSNPIEQIGDLLLGLEKDENGEWSTIKGNPNIVCK